MSNVIDLINYNNFRFVVLSGASPDPKHVELYNAAYNCWMKTWSETYQELKIDKPLYSDEFTRHQDINCIFYGSMFVASVSSRFVDLSLPSTKNDSYFRLWTEEDFSALTKTGNKIMVISNMTVSAEWRKTQKNTVSIKDLIIYLCCRRFVSSSVSTLATFTRNTKNIHKLVERFGATALRENVKNHNENDLVTLFAFYKEKVTEGTDSNVIELGRKMWETRTIDTPSGDALIEKIKVA